MLNIQFNQKFFSNAISILAICLLVFASLTEVFADDMATLKQGKVVVSSYKKGELPTVSAKILVPRPPEKVWSVVQTPQRLMSNERKVKSIQTVSKSGNTQDLKFKVLMTRLFPAFEYTLRHQSLSNKTMKFRRVNGSFKDIQGFWKVESANGGKESILTYNLGLDAGPLIPQNLLMGAVKNDLPTMMTNVKKAILKF